MIDASDGHEWRLYERMRAVLEAYGEGQMEYRALSETLSTLHGMAESLSGQWSRMMYDRLGDIESVVANDATGGAPFPGKEKLVADAARDLQELVADRMRLIRPPRDVLLRWLEESLE